MRTSFRRLGLLVLLSLPAAVFWGSNAAAWQESLDDLGEPARLAASQAAETPVAEDAPAAQPGEAAIGPGEAGTVETPPIEARPFDLAQPIQEAVAKPIPTSKSSDDETPVDKTASPEPSNAQPQADASAEDSGSHFPFKPASFNQVHPGESNSAELKKHWGEPAQVIDRDGLETLVYAIEPFRQITVDVVNDVVAAITVQLAQPVAADELAKRLKLDDMRGVEVTDENDTALGRAFPERGVLFSYRPSGKPSEVELILIESITAEPFFLRARANLHESYRRSLADLNYALQLEPQFADAHWLRAQALLAIGSADEALQAAEQAVALAPDRADIQLTLAACLAEQGKFTSAIDTVKQALAGEQLTPLAKARGLVVLGDLLAEGPNRDYKEAINQHLEAIKLADPLAVSERASLRQGAKAVLVDAHLGVAGDIAWGNWKRKPEVVPKWLLRAEEFSADAIAKGEARLELQLYVAERSLAALSGVRPPLDPQPWIERANKAAGQMIASCEDAAKRRAYQWQLGKAYAAALRIEHLRQSVDSGVHYGDLATKHLEAGAPDRHSSRRARFELGRLYFNVGALQAVHLGNHEKAVTWYDKSAPLINPTDTSDDTDSGQLGEMLVSMAVSYWEVDLRQKSVELTERGAKLMELAVAKGTVPKTVLAVPYGNLAAMHRELGQETQFQKFDQLAKQNQGTQIR